MKKTGPIPDIHKNTVEYFASHIKETEHLDLLAQTAQMLWMQEHRTAGEKKMYRVGNASIMDDPGG